MSRDYYETSTRQRHHRYSKQSDESVGSTHIRSSGSNLSDDANSVNYLAGHLKQTASFDYNRSRNSYHDKENDSYTEHEYEKASSSRNGRNSDPVTKNDRDTLENNYSRAMSQMKRGDYGPARQNFENLKLSTNDSKNRKPKRENNNGRDAVKTVKTRRNRNGMSPDRRVSQSSQISTISTASTSKPVPIQVKKRSVSNKDPSEETIAIFGCYGVTGQYFLRNAIEAGYNIKAMILPGMEMADFASSESMQFIPGTFDEIDKIREVVEDATYVVCLLNDCNHESFNPPIGNNDEDPYCDFNNLNFMHNLVPLLEYSSTCRVMLYEASSLSKDNKGAAPFLSTIVKKVSVRKDWRKTKKEQDRIVKYITHQTKNAHFNYIVTRPSGSIWDRPSRKKLAASKSQPGPFPITNADLAEFTLNALRMEKVYNSCPYVVQDGI